MTSPLFLLGATAVGKSEVALRLAERTGAAILVMDAMQVYRGLEIGVGKPTEAEKRRVLHAGIDLVHWTESFDVARYSAIATDFLLRTNQPVIVCGGTGLYYRALTQGLCVVPTASPELREELSKLELPALQLRLQKVDPGICVHLDQQNPRRLQRAIECMETTGRSLLLWQKETPPPPITHHRSVWLQRPLDSLRIRVMDRVKKMLQAGWTAEVEKLLVEAGEEKLAQCPAIGYKELMEVCRNRLEAQQAEQLIGLQTIHYAKRQITWFKKSPGILPLVAVESVDATSEKVYQWWQSN